MQDLFRHLRAHTRKRKMDDDDICYIHKIAFVPRESVEPIPFAGEVKFVDYVCPMLSLIHI